MELEFILPIIIIIILIKQNSSFKSQIDSLKQSIDKLNTKIDKGLLDPKKNTAVNSESILKTPNEALSPKPKAPQKDTLEETLFKNQNLNKQSIKTDDSTANKSAPKITVNAPKANAASKIKAAKPKISKPNLWHRFKKQNPDLEKFIGENLINKIGILILVLGISYFVKYAIDKDWINEPARVGIGVLAGSLVLGIAHRLRKKYASFSSVLVAGAIAIYYFTIAIAFHEYQLFSQNIAFIIMIVITAFSCLLSLSYNRMELAILSLIGGFAVPFMISTGEGNYKILFSYILILNTGILAIAYFKKWNLVNTLAFTFTNLLFIGWLASFTITNKEIPYNGAFIFASIFYILFTLVNIINNLKNKGEFTKSQLILLASNTFVFYGIGMFILSNYQPQLAGLFTAAIAVLNLLYASFLYKKFGLDKKAVYLLIGLTLTFITLAIPIQFEGNYITLFWAAEAVLLLWLSQKSKISSYRYGSIIVHILMAVSLIMDWQLSYAEEIPLAIIFNPVFITGLVVVASLFSVSYLLRKETIEFSISGFKFNAIEYSNLLNTITPIVLYLVGFLEITYQAFQVYEESTTTLSFPSTYHLVFTAILCFILWKKRTAFGNKVLNAICIINLLIYCFFIALLPFGELKMNISENTHIQSGYLLHFINLVLIIYFVWLLYKTNKDTLTFNFYTKKISLWLLAGSLIFIASNEVILEGLVISNPEITTQQITEFQNNYNTNEELSFYQKYAIASNNIKAQTHKLIKTALPVLWGILSFFFLILGIKKRVQTLRIIALSLLGITILKLFTYDISNVSETGKIIAFILLGVLILIISFVYQKIKVLVIDESTVTVDDKKNTPNDDSKTD